MENQSLHDFESLSMKDQFIQEFEILGLFGYKDICIQFKHTLLIVIGENGFGKTTLLNALNYIITHSYNKLLEIKFKSIRVKIDSRDFSFERQLIEQYVQLVERNKNSEEYSIIDIIKQNVDKKTLLQAVEFINGGQRKEFFSFVNNNDFLKRFPGHLLYQALYTWNEQTKSFEDFQLMEQLIDSYSYKVLYFPTYRRVEVDYDHLFSRGGRHRISRVDEERYSDNRDMNIRFGMDDVLGRIENVLDVIRKSSLEGFTNVSGDIIHKVLTKTIKEI